MDDGVDDFDIIDEAVGGEADGQFHPDEVLIHERAVRQIFDAAVDGGGMGDGGLSEDLS